MHLVSTFAVDAVVGRCYVEDVSSAASSTAIGSTSNCLIGSDTGESGRHGYDRQVKGSELTPRRIEQLEGHVSGIYKKLDEMTNVLSRLAGAPPVSTTPATVSDIVSPRAQYPSHSSHSHSKSHSHHPTHAHTPLNQHTPQQSHGTFRPPPPPSLPSTGSVMSMAVLPEPPEPKEPEPTASRSSSPLSADDMLESAMEGEPFRHFTRREEELHFIEQHGSLPAGGAPRPKKRKTNEQAADWEHSPIHERGDPLRHSFVDPVSSGLVSEQEARALFGRFYKYAHPFIPVFDPERDTYDSLMRRSPFCVTVILMVALHHGESLSGVKSDVCQRIRAEAEKMVKETLFSPAATLETVQGLVAMVSYSEHAWRTCCHVMSLAVDMRLYRCLPYLHKIRKDSRHPDRMLERQRPLVVGARTWLAIVRLSYEMSFNHSLPIQFGSPQRLQYARELIDHPYSTPLDSRLVIACEMCEQREIAFRPWESIATLHPSEIDAGIRRANNGIKELYAHWLAYYEEQGLERDHFLMIELENQKAYCLMYANSSAWYGVLKREDVFRLSPERREWIQEAMRSGAFLVGSLANQRLEKESEFGNHNYCEYIPLALLTIRRRHRRHSTIPDPHGRAPAHSLRPERDLAQHRQTLAQAASLSREAIQRRAAAHIAQGAGAGRAAVHAHDDRLVANGRPSEPGSHTSRTHRVPGLQSVPVARPRAKHWASRRSGRTSGWQR